MPVKLAPVPDPIPHLKDALAREILNILQHRHDLCASRWLRCDWSRVCDLKNGRHSRFSVDKLIRFVTYLDRRVDLKITYTGLQRSYVINERLAGRRDYISYPPPP